MASSFSFDMSRFENPKVMELKLQRALYGVCKYWDGRVEAYMKQKAPWTDRTTNARNGLSATAQKSGSRIMASNFAIVLSHSVDYGVYLELGHRVVSGSGESDEGLNRLDSDEGAVDGFVAPRPIIMPTIEVYGPKVIKTLTKILNRLG